MMKGPKPVRNRNWRENPPRNLRLRQSSDATPEQPVEPEPIEPPKWLDADAREIFATKAAQIRAAKYWDERFSDALALLATLLAEHRRNPAGLSAARLTQLRLLLSELGLTPASARGVTK